VTASRAEMEKVMNGNNPVAVLDDFYITTTGKYYTEMEKKIRSPLK
jgi:hypothetical protein